MPVIVILSEDISDHFRKGAGNSRSLDEAAAALTGALGSLGRVLTPVHPQTADSALSRHFQLDIDDRDQAERAAGLLRGLDGVEAAYWKPAAEAP